MDADKKKKPTWTEDRVETLTKLWGEGLSASAIAKILGGVTRNAVIGKVHRLRLKGRAPAHRTSSTANKTIEVKPPRKAPAAPRTDGATALKQGAGKQPAPVEKPAAKVRLVDPPLKGTITNIMELTRHTCRWPIGDPGEENFAYCGSRAGNGSPYCEHHTKLAYQPSSSQRRRANG